MSPRPVNDRFALLGNTRCCWSRRNRAERGLSPIAKKSAALSARRKFFFDSVLLRSGQHAFDELTELVGSQTGHRRLSVYTFAVSAHVGRVRRSTLYFPAMSAGRAGDATVALLATAFERWPRLAPNRESLSVATHAALTAADEPDTLRADLVLAFALANGDEAALSIFEAEFVPQLESALVRAGISADLVDDALQVVRFRLLVATDNRKARISTYRGRSSLGRWLYVVAIREAPCNGPASNGETDDRPRARRRCDRKRWRPRRRSFSSESIAQRFRRPSVQPLARSRAKSACFFASTSSEGLSDGEIAKIFDVHRTTALRWVERAVTQLVAKAKVELAHDLSVEGSELDSLLRGLVSHLDLSLGRLLAESQPRAVA